MFPHQYKLPLIGIGLIALIIGGAVWYQNQLVENDTHSDEVHVHSDILVYIGDTQLRFTDEKYQSRTGHILHADFHLHDGNDDVIHRHAEGLTLSEFFSSLGFTLTNNCLTTDEGKEYCSGDNEELQMYVNGAIHEDVTNYVPQDEDRILIYFGNPNNPNLSTYLESVSDRACIYSGLCPERGTPPPEECGLTCEI